MAFTPSWLAGPAPTARLDRDRLDERILNLLTTQNMCVLATTGRDGPLATPVRYFHLDFTVVITAAPNSPKIRSIAADPRVSIGIFAPLVGQASSRGAQLFGKARTLSPGHPEHGHYVPAEYSEHTLIVVAAERIVYTEHWLRRDGYAPRQHWRAP